MQGRRHGLRQCLGLRLGLSLQQVLGKVLMGLGLREHMLLGYGLLQRGLLGRRLGHVLVQHGLLRQELVSWGLLRLDNARALGWFGGGLE